MNVDQNKVKSIFLVASEMPAGERTDYLEKATAGDALLKARVEALLKAHDGSDSFLPELVAKAPGTIDFSYPEDSVAEKPGDQIGPYKLLEQVGEGGMGVVYMAEQLAPLRRRVALKIIKVGMDTRQVIARFEAERQALAMMDHANIAHVLDAGTTDSGRPYFVMELVKGIPITDYCDTYHLSIQERLRLMIGVCMAVQHAHQKGVIHRDIKPSNVLVAEYDGTPVPKVIDFGVARATGQQLTEKTMFTQFGQIVGTFEYMSPEQARFNQLDVDTRSDVYSLGVLLYELLVGSTPLEKERLRSAAFEEMLRIIGEEEPPFPSTRLSSSQSLPSIAANRAMEATRICAVIKGELDWVVMKALDKDRNRRYETANGLAADIQRYLKDETVSACPPSSSYRVRKFARRNKKSLAFAGTVAATLIVGAAAATWQAVRATEAEMLAETRLSNERKAREVAIAQQKIAVAERQVAEAERAAAELERKRAATEAVRAASVAGFLKQLIGSADPLQSKGYDYTVQELLDEASQDLTDQFKGQPDVEADIRSTIGSAYFHLNLYEDAQPHLERAAQLRRQTLGADHERYADSLVVWGWNLASQGFSLLASQRVHEALSIYRERHSGPGRRLGALRVLQWISEDVFSEAMEVAQELPGGEHPDLASILHVQAEFMAKRGEAPAAEALARRALAMHQRLRPSGHPEIAWATWTLGIALENQEKFAEAETQFRQALELFTNGYGRRPNARGIRRTLDSLQGVLTSQSKHQDLQDLVQRYESPADEPARASTTALAAIRRGESCLEFSKWAQALAEFDAASAIVSYDDVESLLRLAEGYRRAGICLSLGPALADAKRARNQEVRFREQVLRMAPDDPRTILSDCFLAQRYLDLGRRADANKIVEGARAKLLTRLKLDQIGLTLDVLLVASTYVALGRDDEALDMIETAASKSDATDNSDTLVQDPVLTGLAFQFARLEKWEHAAQLFARAYDQSPTDHGLILPAAASALGADDIDLYRHVCRVALVQFADTEDPVAADRVSKACMIFAPTDAQLHQATQLADVAIENGTDHAWIHYFQMTRGIAAYRNGDFSGVLEWCGRSRRVSFPPNDVLNSLIEAMAHHQLDQDPEASVAMDRAMEILDRQLPKLRDNWGSDWSDWLICQIVSREAKALLATDSSIQDQDSGHGSSKDRQQEQ